MEMLKQKNAIWLRNKQFQVLMLTLLTVGLAVSNKWQACSHHCEVSWQCSVGSEQQVGVSLTPVYRGA